MTENLICPQTIAAVSPDFKTEDLPLVFSLSCFFPISSIYFFRNSSTIWNHHNRGGPMFVAFMGSHCLRIYIPTNLYTIIRLIFIKIFPTALPTKLSQQTRKMFDTHEHWPPRIKMIPQYFVS